MKKISTFLLAILLLLQLTAFGKTKSVHVKNEKWNKQNAHIRGKLQQQATKRQHQQSVKKSTARTTAEYAQRLIAWSDEVISDSGNTLTDSTQYVYSSDNSSLFNYNSMGYNNYFGLPGSLIFQYSLGIGFWDHNSAPSIFCDSAYMLNLDTLLPGAYTDVQAFTYDSSKNVLDFIDQATGDSTTSYTNNQYINTFDSLNNITISYALSWSYGIWDTTENRIFLYDSMNRVYEDSSNMYLGSGMWTPQEMWKYFYNDSGNIILAIYYTYDTTGWQPQTMYNMTYYGDTTLMTDSISMVSTYTSLWMPEQRDSFGYTSGINYWTLGKTTEYNLDSGTIYEYHIITKNVSGIGLPDTLYSSWCYPPGLLENVEKVAFTYDSYQEPTHAYNFLFNVTDSSTGDGYYDSIPTIQSNYYYELYEIFGVYHLSSTPKTVQSSFNIHIFPNPTTNTLNINIADYPKGNLIMFTLINAAGQRVRTESLPWLQDTETFPMGGLAPGVYWLLAQDKAGNTIGRQQVVKE